MRIFSYILIFLVTIFLLNTAFSFFLPNYRNTLINARSHFFTPTNTVIVDSGIEKNQSENTHLIESLNRIDKHIESLVEVKKTNSGSINTIGSSIGTGVVTNIQKEEDIVQKPEIPLSGIFLAKIMPEITPKKIDNSGFFGIKIMNNIVYNTYFDDKKNIKIYAFNDSYDAIILNMKLASSIYTLNETDQFFGFTTFLNSTKKDSKDTTIRFITALEGRAIGVEVPKNYYSSFKKMLLKNK